MLQIAMILARFSGDEADELRRALSFHRSPDRMNRAIERLRAGMTGERVPAWVQEQVVKSVGSFALYGFPESHAISFAHLAYASAWLKVHHPAEFFMALLNNQPMGFYSAATLVRDARRHGVRVRPVCAARSAWECVVEEPGVIRLGLCRVKGLRRDRADAIVRALRTYNAGSEAFRRESEAYEHAYD